MKIPACVRARAIRADHRLGRLLLELARIVRDDVMAMMPGPVWSTGAAGVPMLSWFALPYRGNSQTTMCDALSRLFANDRELGESPDVVRLMKRLVLAGAGRNRAIKCGCPAELSAMPGLRKILLIDQRKYAGLGAGAPFQRMLATAKAEHPDAELWLWPSSDNAFGSWQLSPMLPEVTRKIGQGYHFFSILSQIDYVYTVDAPEGMEALVAGMPVRVFGTPFYAGWGLTHDDIALPERRARPTVAALFDAVYLRLARYVAPDSDEPGSLDQVLDSIELQYAVRERFGDCTNIAGVRFQLWKRPFATPFLAAGGGPLRWLRSPDAVKPNECIALWGDKHVEGITPGTRIIRMEDGFFHSLGLGSDMSAPLSQVIDRRGLYFDARVPSDLTDILNETQFSDAELTRAESLRELIVRSGVTKYNLGRRKPAWHAPASKTLLFVPGQVADDASIRLGTSLFGSAEALLREVRARNPDGFIVYKPHPDVLSGNRIGLIDAHRLADIVDTDADVLSLIERADEVHTLSSLAGFDALLRGKKVFTYGLPFYAGWGLTSDAIQPIPWRRRTLTLEMLVAGALLRYPIYWNWKTRLYVTPESVVHKLAPFAARPLERVRGDRRRALRKAFRWTRNIFRHLLWTVAQYRQAQKSNV
ncbi:MULTISPECIES: capsular polysaccharide biosynthesis protein [Burkholderia]|uniref:Capsular biosynthesis protein n=1 Tax=Burkholderia mayonis TaxID=1385591 RepID=A0A1B4FBJ3_9BURK|nr:MULTISPECIES: capsular biosynthesis protein [Burkholderia]AOJ01038.1 capsular biosynthesis protein [Burkholderia mayonis]KVE41984.1 capsular biosynthesis protein [Burkholderia sp. BDU5]KVE49890.1 capsular biosynthesis protein [Burkholderia mayonis]